MRLLNWNSKRDPPAFSAESIAAWIGFSIIRDRSEISDIENRPSAMRNRYFRPFVTTIRETGKPKLRLNTSKGLPDKMSGIKIRPRNSVIGKRGMNTINLSCYALTSNDYFTDKNIQSYSFEIRYDQVVGRGRDALAAAIKKYSL